MQTVHIAPTLIATTMPPRITVRSITGEARIAVTIPRADMQVWAIAHLIASKVCSAIADAQHSALYGLPSIVAGKSGTCVVVSIPCYSQPAIAQMLPRLVGWARFAARSIASGGAYRVEMSK